MDLHKVRVISCAYTPRSAMQSFTHKKKIRSATPGRLSEFEEELSRVNNDASMDAAALSVAVTIGNTEGATGVGVAVIDMVARTLAACQFADDMQLCALESVLVQLGAKECVIPKVGCSRQC